MDRIMNEVRKVADKLADIDIAALFDRVEKTISGAESLVNDPDLRRTIDHMRSASAGLDNILTGLSGPRQGRDWETIHRDITVTAADLRRVSDKLALMTRDLPPDAAEKIVTGAQGIVETGQKAIGSWDREVDRNLGLLEGTIREINRLVSEMDRLVNTLRQEPGRILERRQGADPFAR